MRKLINYMKHRNIFTETLAFIAIPAVFVILILIVTVFIYSNSYKNMVKSSCLSTLETFCSQQESSMQNISHSISVLSENKRFVDTIDGDLTSLADITYTQKILRKIKLNHSCIDSISVFERDSMQVYTNNNVYSAVEYFSSIYSYDDYSLQYWQRYRSPFSEKAFLAPCSVTATDEQKHIIPVVFTRIGDKYIKNIVIINIDIDNITALYDSYKVFDSTKLLLINKKTHRIFGKDDFYEAEEEFYNRLPKEGAGSFDYKIDGTNRLILSYTPRYSILGYIYVSVIPHSDINTASLKLTRQLLVMILFSLIVLVIIIAFMTKKAYYPFVRITNLLGNDNKPEDFEDIYRSIADVLSDKAKLSAELDDTLPIIEEQYLIHLLNSSSHYYSNKQFNDKISFDYDFFCSIIIRFQPKKSFYEKYGRFEESALEGSLFGIIRYEFASHFKTYIIPSDEHTLYILLNLQTPDVEPEIHEIINRLEELLANDKEDLTLTVAYGTINEGIDGLKQSHKTALETLSGTKWINNLHVKIDEEMSHRQSLQFSQTDERTVYNHLLVGNIDSALAIIEDIIQRNTQLNISTNEIIQLYVSIFNIIFKVMRQKNIEYDENNIGDIGIISDIISHNNDEIHNIMITLLDKLHKYIKTNKVDIGAILEYIQKNYTQNESLESIAEHFGVSASYLSRLIKKTTLQTFTDYVNTLRIDEAKRLLAATNNSIADIYTQLGFNNRNTFIRLFKQLVGTTPSEYRAKFRV